MDHSHASGVSAWRLGFAWIGCALAGPALLFGFWIAPVMRVMDTIRRSSPKAEWVLAIHDVSLMVLLGSLAAVLVVSVMFMRQGQRAAAVTLLVGGSGSLYALSFGVLLLVWV